MVGQGQATILTLKRNYEIGTMNMEPLILLFSFGYLDEIVEPSNYNRQSY